MARIYQAYRGILATLLLQRILAQGAAPIQLYIKLVVIPARAIDVHAIRIVGIAGGVEQSTKRAIEANTDFHIIILAFGLNVCREMGNK